MDNGFVCAVTGKKYSTDPTDENFVKDLITVTSGLSGHFAVHMWFNTEDEEMGGFWEPWQSGIGRYATKEEAEIEAKSWAEMDELPCELKTQVQKPA